MIGITERGDAGLDMSWVNMLNKVDFAVLITKNPTKGFIERAAKNKDKLIIHITCTGYGGTTVEPTVPKKEVVKEATEKLISSGFPVEQLVLRVEPVVPTPKGIDVALEVMELFKDTNICRLRYSYLDMYSHVKERFKKNKIAIPYNTFYPPMHLQKEFEKRVEDYRGVYEIEVCAGINRDSRPCISKKDSEILGLKGIDFTSNHLQRKTCSCPDIKMDLLSNKSQCPHRCLYCYWKSDYTGILQ